MSAGTLPVLGRVFSFCATQGFTTYLHGAGLPMQRTSAVVQFSVALALPAGLLEMQGRPHCVLLTAAKAFN